MRRYRFDDDLLGLSGVPVRLWMSNVVSLKLGYGRWEVRPFSEVKSAEVKNELKVNQCQTQYYILWVNQLKRYLASNGHAIY